MAKTSYSLSHTKWMCKYHIVFTPKYRRKSIYYKIRQDLIDIFRHLCQYKGVEIIEGHMMPDHVHMLVLIPPKLSISDFMGYLKSKSALMIFDKHANLKYKYSDYITYLYPNNLKKEDKEFLMAVQGENILTEDYALVEISEVYDRLDDSDFDYDSILNFDLLKYTLTEEASIERITKYLSEERYTFLNRFLQNSSIATDYHIALITELMRHNQETLKRIFVSDNIVGKDKIYISNLLLSSVDLRIYDIKSNFKEVLVSFVEDNWKTIQNSLDNFREPSKVNNSQVQANLLHLDVKIIAFASLCLGNLFDEEDLDYIISDYPTFNQEVQNVIFNKTKSFIEEIVSEELTLDKQLLSRIISVETIDITSRQVLLSRQLSDFSSQELNEKLQIVKLLECYNNVMSIISRNGNPKLEINEINKNILEFLKNNDKLSSYREERSYYRGYSKKTKIKTKA